DRQLGIELPQSEIIAGELRGNHQTNIFEVSCVGLIGCLRRFNAPPAPPEQIHFVSDDERQRETVLGYSGSHWDRVPGRTISGKAQALGLRGTVESGELRCHLQRRGGPRLLQLRNGNFYSLIGVERLLF